MPALKTPSTADGAVKLAEKLRDTHAERDLYREQLRMLQEAAYVLHREGSLGSRAPTL